MSFSDHRFSGIAIPAPVEHDTSHPVEEAGPEATNTSTVFPRGNPWEQHFGCYVGRQVHYTKAEGAEE